MDIIQIFEHSEFGKVRVVEIEGTPWFAGKDVAAVLGYVNPRDALAKHVDKEDKMLAKCDTLGGVQELTVINESGLYSLVFSSKLPSAKKFTRWVTSEVLPSIRKHRMYISNPKYDVSALSPELQRCKQILDNMIQAQLEQKRQAEEQKNK